ncbi:MAG: ATP-dependent Clp protease proteolytic subunit [Chlamydiota bacterium]
MALVPYVIEDTGRGERSMDIYSRLLKDRIILIGSEISDQLANAVIAQLLFLQTEDPKKDISIYINSPGGSVTAGLAIYDTMQFMSFDINTYCIGQAASMAAVLLSAGTKGKRYVLPNSAVMIHQPYGGVTGSAEDISRQIDQILKSKDVMSGIMAKHTGQELSKIIADCDRDYYMSAKEAIAYGAADKEVLPRQHEETPK